MTVETWDVLDFLRESNNIEDVWDDRSLVDAYHAWEVLVTHERMTPWLVLLAHGLLMTHQPTLADDQKGRYRTCAVYIGGREGAQWELVPGLIRDWCEHVNTSADFKGDHVAYERIHPFVDGNGRTGRLFLNWQRVRLGLPLLTIKNAEKQDYYRWFTDSGIQNRRMA